MKSNRQTQALAPQLPVVVQDSKPRVYNPLIKEVADTHFKHIRDLMQPAQHHIPLAVYPVVLSETKRIKTHPPSASLWMSRRIILSEAMCPKVRTGLSACPSAGTAASVPYHSAPTSSVSRARCGTPKSSTRWFTNLCGRYLAGSVPVSASNSMPP